MRNRFSHAGFQGSHAGFQFCFGLSCLPRTLKYSFCLLQFVIRLAGRLMRCSVSPLCLSQMACKEAKMYDMLPIIGWR